MKHICYISMGTNLGDRMVNLEKAIFKLSSFVSILKTSSLYETEPWGYKDNNDYLNIVIKIQTNLTPIHLLKKIKNIEKEMGRKKQKKITYVARIIDLDILFFSSLIINMDHLIIPHPKLYNRNYVLKPLSEIDPEFRCPHTDKKVAELLLECDDDSKIIRYTH